MKRLVLLSWMLVVGMGSAADWPQFRGPTGDGVYKGAPLPTEWGPETNVAWKTTIPGKGWSSPIVLSGHIYLTTAVPNKEGGHSLRGVCLDAASGKIVWNTEVLTLGTDAPKIHSKNSHASPTPTTDGERIYVHFGHAGTAALDLQGKVIWTRTGLYKQPVHGSGGSPILVDGFLIFSIDAVDKQAVIALDAASGKTVWETARKSKPVKPFSFTTPTIVEHDGKTAIISVGSDMVGCYDAKTGNEFWRSSFSGYSIIQRPVIAHDMVYFASAYDRSSLVSVKLGGTGDVTKTHAGWTTNKAVPHAASFIIVGAELYMISDAGIASCLDAKSGDVHWSERLKGNYSASPIYADGKLYFTSETGQGTLVEAGRKFNKLGEFDLKEKTFASFAAVDGALFVRTETQLYKFAKK
jgi:outer membrane protein assembly factor BamB